MKRKKKIQQNISHQLDLRTGRGIQQKKNIYVMLKKVFICWGHHWASFFCLSIGRGGLQLVVRATMFRSGTLTGVSLCAMGPIRSYPLTGPASSAHKGLAGSVVNQNTREKQDPFWWFFSLLLLLGSEDIHFFSSLSRFFYMLFTDFMCQHSERA